MNTSTDSEGNSHFLPFFAASMVFLSAWLLFLVEPIAVKQVLPTLGGSPLVWNTAMVFFQFFLLMGYMSAHLILRMRSGRMQFAAYVAIMLVSFLFLPFTMRAPGSVDPALSPFSWILGSLVFSLSLPFLLLSMTNTLVQGWIIQGKSSLAKKPYVLYAASNAGSLLSLLAFFPLEYLYPLPVLESAWTWLFVLLGPMICVLALTVGVPHMVHQEDVAGADTADKPGMPQYLHWIGLAFIPSGLFLGVTTYITTNIASVPLLWIAPLALYLLTFILAFSEKGWGIDLAQKWQVPFILALSLFLSLRQHFLQLMPVHLLGLFVIALACHGMLARLKPNPRYLSVFYLCVSIGGVLGGIFCSLIAPQLFNWPLEYPILLVAAALARPNIWKIDDPSRRLRRDIIYPLCIAAGIGAAFYLLRHVTHGTLIRQLTDRSVALTAVIAITWLCDLLYERKISFTLIVTVILITAPFDPPEFEHELLYVERNFFGIDSVYHYVDGKRHFDVNLFKHGTTLHGLQPREKKINLVYTSYYWMVKQLYDLLDPDLKAAPVAITGLGAGTAVCLGTHAHFDLFEINPDVVKIARDETLFTYMRDCGGDSTVVLGDGRISVSHEPDGRYGYMILDAFSSDAIPTHLLTLEALQMYLKKLKPGGIIAINITNNFFNLAPMMGKAAKALGLEGYVVVHTKPAITKYEMSSTWVTLAPSYTPLQREKLRELGAQPLPVGRHAVWTDQYSNILPYLK